MRHITMLTARRPVTASAANDFLDKTTIIVGLTTSIVTLLGLVSTVFGINFQKNGTQA